MAVRNVFKEYELTEKTCAELILLAWERARIFDPDEIAELCHMSPITVRHVKYELRRYGKLPDGYPRYKSGKHPKGLIELINAWGGRAKSIGQVAEQTGLSYGAIVMRLDYYRKKGLVVEHCGKKGRERLVKLKIRNVDHAPS